MGIPLHITTAYNSGTQAVHSVRYNSQSLRACALDSLFLLDISSLLALG
jgi:hypothetical protein